MARLHRVHREESVTSGEKKLQREVCQRELQGEAYLRVAAVRAIQRSVSSADSTNSWMEDMLYYEGYPIWVPVWRFSYRYGIWVLV